MFPPNTEYIHLHIPRTGRNRGGKLESETTKKINQDELFRKLQVFQLGY